MQKTKSRNEKILIIVFLLIVFILGISAICVILWINAMSEMQIEIHTDITEYNDYIGENAKEKYRMKSGMDESIFPAKITENMNVRDYKMIYYNPWDAQYLSYLVVSYDEETYAQEMDRLAAYESAEYLGNYGVTGFSDNYTLAAMDADEYAGFVYALSDNKDTIIYVEMIFCNYFMDLDYKEYIPGEYLPLGFDATVDNPYRTEMLKAK